VLARKPDLAEGSIALSNIYLQKLDMPKALNYARRAFSSSPRTETRLGLASALLAAGKLGEAQRELDTLLKSDPKNPQVQYSAYELASSLNETDVAQRHLEAAVNMAAARSDWLIELSDLYKESGDYFDARKTLERALVVDPDSIDALNKLAVIYEFYLHDYDQATEAYHRILSIDSDSVSALAGLDRCKVKKNDISGALKYQLRNVFQDLFSLMGKNQSE
jgi:Tfp pilus assembly protein PilF